MKSFNDQTGAIYVDYFNENGEEKTLDFVIKTHIGLNVLCSIYDKGLKDGTFEDMAKITTDKKDKYWKIACRYYETLGDRLKASKAVYALELITSNF